MSNKFVLCILPLLFAVFTASCGLVDSNSPSENLPQSSASQGSPAIGAPVALPPQYGARPLKPGESKPDLMPNGLPALQPAGVGVGGGNIFAEKLRNDDARFDRLENAVSGLRLEFESFKPAITRLVAVESDIQDLITQLDILLRNEPEPYSNNADSSYVENMTPFMEDSPPPAVESQPLEPDVDFAVPPAPIPAPVAAPIAAPIATPLSPPPPKMVEKVMDPIADAKPPPPASPPTPPRVESRAARPPKSQPQPKVASLSGPPSVKALRIGEHSDTVRLVMDLTRPTTFSADLDNTEKLLVIELMGAKWDAAKPKNFSGSVLKSYSVEPINDGKGSRVMIILNKATSIVKEQTAAPDDYLPTHRIIIDLKT